MYTLKQVIKSEDVDIFHQSEQFPVGSMDDSSPHKQEIKSEEYFEIDNQWNAQVDAANNDSDSLFLFVKEGLLASDVGITKYEKQQENVCLKERLIADNSSYKKQKSTDGMLQGKIDVNEKPLMMQLNSSERLENRGFCNNKSISTSVLQTSTSVFHWRSPADGSSQKKFTSPPDETCIIPQQDKSPEAYYNMFLTEDILQLIVEETNRNAVQSIDTVCMSRSCRLQKWKDTEKDEMKKFLGLILYMGLVKYPKIDDYWSKHVIFSNEFCPKIMPRNRFQLLLRYIHFEDNQIKDKSSQLYKVERIMEKIVRNFKAAQQPGENLVIDETMIGFRGRLGFRQYIPGKTHNYGFKIFKLTDPKGFTYNVSVCLGKSIGNEDFLRNATSICIKLASDYLQMGRTLTVDSFYTSLELAKKCLENQTHLQGTMRKNCRGLPKIDKKIKRGECETREADGIVIGVWKDEREVSFLSTKEAGKLSPTNKRNRAGEEVIKPDVIISCNMCKQGIDLSDQMSSYFSPFRNTVQWYHKVVFELLLNIAIVNAYIMYNKHDGSRNMKIADFRKNIVLSLTGLNDVKNSELEPRVSNTRHVLIQEEDKTSKNRKKRSRCASCYAEISKNEGSCIARKKAKLVNTKCSTCPNNQYFCLEHFQKYH